MYKTVILFTIILTSASSLFAQCDIDYKNLSSGNKRVLDQKVKTCGCPENPASITEYAVFTPEKAKRVLGISVNSDIKSVVVKRSGWSYSFSSCSNVRFWSDTGADGKVYEKSTKSVDDWSGEYIDGIEVKENFGISW